MFVPGITLFNVVLEQRIPECDPEPEQSRIYKLPIPRGIYPAFGTRDWQTARTGVCAPYLVWSVGHRGMWLIA